MKYGAISECSAKIGIRTGPTPDTRKKSAKQQRPQASKQARNHQPQSSKHRSTSSYTKKLHLLVSFVHTLRRRRFLAIPILIANRPPPLHLADLRPAPLDLVATGLRAPQALLAELPAQRVRDAGHDRRRETVGFAGQFGDDVALAFRARDWSQRSACCVG